MRIAFLKSRSPLPNCAPGVAGRAFLDSRPEDAALHKRTRGMLSGVLQLLVERCIRNP